jgi:hypothetical protein
MTANITFNPMVTSNASGSFNVQSQGYIQGMAMDDPSARYRLAGGVLKSSESLPMWGGVGISETSSPVSGGPTNGETGGNITRATTQTAGASGQLTGFSVFDQNYSAINTPQSPVPLVGTGGQVNFYRLGSNARIAVAIDDALISQEGDVITQDVSWDFVNQRLIPYVGTLTISSGTYNDTTGEVVLTMSAPVTFGDGDAVIVSGLTGTGAYASLNGTFTATAVSGSTVTYNAGAGAGASTITGGSLTLGSGASSKLPCKVLNIDIGNSMVVEYDADTGFATWNRSGSCAVIQI